MRYSIDDGWLIGQFHHLIISSTISPSYHLPSTISHLSSNRRGILINHQNYHGNTALHYAFHYGYGESLGFDPHLPHYFLLVCLFSSLFCYLGEYLISKGGDDSILNDLNYTCYEGIG